MVAASASHEEVWHNLHHLRPICAVYPSGLGKRPAEVRMSAHAAVHTRPGLTASRPGHRDIHSPPNFLKARTFELVFPLDLRSGQPDRASSGEQEDPQRRAD